MKPIIEIKQLRKSFGGLEVLKGVDLEIMPGEIFGFLGPNGAGKTTTLRILTTLLPLDGGEALIDGLSIANDSHEVRSRIGYVSQTGGADIRSTGLENLVLQGRLHGMTKDEAHKRALEMVDTFDLSECIQRPVSTYSGGQQRRLDIALGIMHHPKILFLDEPTNGLDPQNRANLWRMIKSLKAKGTTIFLTSHYLDEVDELSDRLAILDHGAVVARGTSVELKKQISGDIVTIGFHEKHQENAKNIFTSEHGFIREAIWQDQNLRLYVDQGESALQHILRLLDVAKVPLETINMSLPSLNDVFLKKTGRSIREDKS